MNDGDLRRRSRQSTARREAVETAALWKLWKNPSKEASDLFVIFPPVPTALGKLSAKNNSAESFPQFPQLRRLGSYRERRTSEQRRYPGLCCAESSRSGCLDVYPEAGCQKSPMRSLLRSGLLLTAPFIEQPLS